MSLHIIRNKDPATVPLPGGPYPSQASPSPAAATVPLPGRPYPSQTGPSQAVDMAGQRQGSQRHQMTGL